MKKRYKILIKENGLEDKLIHIETSDLKKYIEEYSRTRHIVSWEVIKEDTTSKKGLLFG